MNRRLIYLLSLIGFFTMWGVFSVGASAPRSESALQGTEVSSASTLAVSGTMANAAIPVTGETEPVAGILFIYGLFGLGALVLILALLNSANKSTALYLPHEEPPDES